MLVLKIIFLIFSVLYSIYLFSYSKWEKNINQNKFGSFFIKLFILTNFAIIITSFFEKIYYTS